jgi:UDP-GlcNAc:undecaprenyl-phosphate/decaprenyl-phosphate GlcNAc-1-phosphate transferase
MLAGAAVLSFVVAFVAVRVLLSRFGRFALDQPNERSLHERPVPRTGGVVVLLGAAVSLAFGAAPLWPAFALALGLAVLSFMDDLSGLPTRARLAAHVAAAGFWTWYVLSPMHPVELAVLIVAVTWITNLYNFMDGSDGLAGGMATIGFGAYGLAAWWGGDAALAALCVALSAAAFAFLLHNHHPARIFLGDVGSIPLGFLAAALGIVGWRNDLWPLWFPVMVFGPVHRRCDDHARAPGPAPRARLGGAPRPLLSADGAHGSWPPRHRVDRLCRHVVVRRRCASRAGPGSGDAGHGVPGS